MRSALVCTGWSRLGSMTALMDRTLLVALFSLALIGLLMQHRIREAIGEALENFRGGPPSGMHPLPGDDRIVLLRRREKVSGD